MNYTLTEECPRCGHLQELYTHRPEMHFEAQHLMRCVQRHAWVYWSAAALATTEEDDA